MSGVQNSTTPSIQPQIIDIPLHIDDRGSVYCIMDNLQDKKIERTYVVRNWRPGLIRAWHGHKLAETFIHVIKGVAKVCAMKIDDANQGNPLYSKAREFKIVTLSGAKPQLFWVPAGWYNGTMTLQDDTRILVYSTLTFNQVKLDDFRKKLTDEEVVEIWRVENR
jgi:dTDP-4-dehydrorhamnose 3,5-epimerase-like enzyme